MVAVWSVHLISGKSVKHVSNVRLEKVGTLRSFKEGATWPAYPSLIKSIPKLEMKNLKKEYFLKDSLTYQFKFSVFIT